MSEYTININRPGWQHSLPIYRHNMSPHTSESSDGSPISDKTTDWIDLVKWRAEHNLQPYDYYATMPKYYFALLPKTEMNDPVPSTDGLLPSTPVNSPFGGKSLKH